MKNKLHHIILVILALLTTIMTSCHPETEYKYIISNKSSEDIYILLCPQNSYDINWNPQNGEGIYCNENLYIINYISGETREIEYPLSSLYLAPGEIVKFSDIVLMVSAFVNKNPEKGGSKPLWLRNNCIDQILVRDKLDDKYKEISEQCWANSNNWIRRNKKSTSVEYWLVIDDEVIQRYCLDTEEL